MVLAALDLIVILSRLLYFSSISGSTWSFLNFSKSSHFSLHYSSILGSTLHPSIITLELCLHLKYSLPEILFVADALKSDEGLPELDASDNYLRVEDVPLEGAVN